MSILHDARRAREILWHQPTADNPTNYGRKTELNSYDIAMIDAHLESILSQIKEVLRIVETQTYER